MFRIGTMAALVALVLMLVVGSKVQGQSKSAPSCTDTADANTIVSALNVKVAWLERQVQLLTAQKSAILSMYSIEDQLRQQAANKPEVAAPISTTIKPSSSPSPPPDKKEKIQ